MAILHPYGSVGLASRGPGNHLNVLQSALQLLNGISTVEIIHACQSAGEGPAKVYHIM